MAAGTIIRRIAQTLFTLCSWNVIMYYVTSSQYSMISVIALLYLLLFLSLKLTFELAQIEPQLIPKSTEGQVQMCYERINSACQRLHHHLKSPNILILVWACVKLSVYSRFFGTLGMIWVGLNAVLIVQAVQIHLGLDLVKAVVEIRRTILNYLWRAVSAIPRAKSCKCY